MAGNLVTAALDRSAALASDKWVSPWTGATYRGSAFTARHGDFALFAALAALQAFWLMPATADEAVARGVANVALLILAAWWIATRDPFKRTEPWKRHVKVGLLLLAALAAVLTHATLATEATDIDVGSGAISDEKLEADRAAQQHLSIAVFVGCMLLFATLGLSFAASSIMGAQREQLQSKAAAAANATRAWASRLAAALGSPSSGAGLEFASAVQLRPPRRSTARASFSASLLTTVSSPMGTHAGGSKPADHVAVAAALARSSVVSTGAQQPAAPLSVAAAVNASGSGRTRARASMVRGAAAPAAPRGAAQQRSRGGRGLAGSAALSTALVELAAATGDIAAASDEKRL